jgi:hypothetical protein
MITKHIIVHSFVCLFLNNNATRIYTFMPVDYRPFILILYVISLAFCIGLFGIPLVQADETDVPTLDPIIVTGSVHPTRLHRSTQSHTIVDFHDNASFQSNRLSSVLQQVPGIHLYEMGGRGGIS